jgi:hypothetical protein
VRILHECHAGNVRRRHGVVLHGVFEPLYKINLRHDLCQFWLQDSQSFSPQSPLRLVAFHDFHSKLIPHRSEVYLLNRFICCRDASHVAGTASCCGVRGSGERKVVGPSFESHQDRCESSGCLPSSSRQAVSLCSSLPWLTPSLRRTNLSAKKNFCQAVQLHLVTHVVIILPIE